MLAPFMIMVTDGGGDDDDDVVITTAIVLQSQVSDLTVSRDITETTVFVLLLFVFLQPTCSSCRLSPRSLEPCSPSTL